MPSMYEPGVGPAGTARETKTRNSSASPVDSSRIHRLLRSLVGVADVSLIVTPEGKLRSVAVLRDGNVQEHQLVRNVVSGLKAGFGLRLEPGDVQVVLHAEAWQQRAAETARAVAKPAASAPVESSATRPQTGGATPTGGNGKQSNGNGKHSNGNGAARLNGNGTAGGNGRLHPVPLRIAPFEANAAAPGAESEPAVDPAKDAREPRLDSIDVERHGAALRCRVSVRVGERTYSAIAEVRDAPTAEAELAARVTLDALRAGGLTSARLDGVSLTMICDVVYVVAAVRTAASAAPRASAAPLLQNMANAAAAAVLRAHGPVGIVEPRAALNGTI
jgi:hypothetical protein